MKKLLSKIKIHPAIFFTISILYLELMARFIITKQIFNSDFIYVIIFSIPFILICTLLTKLFPKIIDKSISYHKITTRMTEFNSLKMQLRKYSYTRHRMSKITQNS